MESVASLAASRTIEGILAGDWHSLLVEAKNMLFDGHGGRRPGAGRPPRFGDRQGILTIVLSKAHFDYLMAHSDGPTECIRTLVSEFEKTLLEPEKYRGTRGETTRRTSIRLPEKDRKRLEYIGAGSAVSGIRRLIDLKLAQQESHHAPPP